MPGNFENALKNVKALLFHFFNPTERSERASIRGRHKRILNTVVVRSMVW